MHTPRKILKVSVCPYHINGTVSRKVKDKVEDTKVVMCSIQFINRNVSRNVKR